MAVRSTVTLTTESNQSSIITQRLPKSAAAVFYTQTMRILRGLGIKKTEIRFSTGLRFTYSTRTAPT